MNYLTIPGIRGNFIAQNSKFYTIRAKDIICKEYEITLKEFHSKSHLRNYVEARQIFCYLVRENTSLSLQQIGNLIGGRDHATALWGANKIKDLIEFDKEMKTKVDKLRAKIQIKEDPDDQSLTIADLKKYTPRAKMDLIEMA